MIEPGLPTTDFALAIAPVTADGPPRDGLAEAIAWTATLGLRHIQLDARMPGLRPRDLDRSSRREIASIVRRQGLSCAGIDLWIPPEHFLDSARADRAMSAAMEAIRFLSEVAPLSRGEAAPSAVEPVVALTLPTEAAHADLRAQLAEEATAHGVRIADHTWPPDAEFEHDHLGLGIDPATILISGDLSPARAMAKNSPRLISARLSDTDGVARLPAGDGRLDVFEYVATALTCGLRAPIVIDVREVASPRGAVGRIIEATGFVPGNT